MFYKTHLTSHYTLAQACHALKYKFSLLPNPDKIITTVLSSHTLRWWVKAVKKVQIQSFQSSAGVKSYLEKIEFQPNPAIIAGHNIAKCKSVFSLML